MDETKSQSETEISEPLVEGSGSSSDETKDLSETKGSQPLEGSGVPTLAVFFFFFFFFVFFVFFYFFSFFFFAIPRGSGATGSSAVSVKVGSDGFISPTMTILTAPWRSRCRTLNASLTPRMWKPT